MTRPGPSLAEIRADARSAVDRYWSDRRAAAVQAMSESIDAALRARLYHQLRTRLIEGPPITFPNDDELRSDMTAFTLAPSFKCPYCGAVSYHPKDIEHRYCGRCHVFVDDGPPPPRDDDDAHRRACDANLAVLLAARADKTGGEPADWRPEVLWCWRCIALRTAHEALFIGKARGGFSPSPVRWVIVCWAEPEPRRSLMLGLCAPWRPRRDFLATPWERD